MNGQEKIVAVSLLTETEFRTLGPNLKRVFPLPNDGEFDELLRAIRRASDGKPPKSP
jgi:hypothetical protein